jgi:hypothetical protein
MESYIHWHALHTHSVRKSMKRADDVNGPGWDYITWAKWLEGMCENKMLLVKYKEESNEWQKERKKKEKKGEQKGSMKTKK